MAAHFDAASLMAAEAVVLGVFSPAPPSACELQPAAFFLAWQGVLTLAFLGWPPPLAAFKSALNAAGGLKAEGAGSKWPKATLAATADGAPPLTLGELALLRGFCEAHGASARAAAAVAVDELSLVRYARRGLEARAGAPAPAARALALAQPRDCAAPAPEEAARARDTLAEWDGERLAAYLEGANRAGSRISSYREDSPAGATLVAWLAAASPALRAALRAFRTEVDAAFPSRFVWLDEESLHVTVRGLVW